MGQQLDRQATFNEQIAYAVRDVEALTSIVEERHKLGWINLDHRLGRAETETQRVERRLVESVRTFGGSLAELDVRLNDAEGQLAGVGSRWTAVFAALDELRGEVEHRRAENAALRARVEALEAASQTPNDGETPLPGPRPGAAPSFIDAIYLEFEESFRGSREHVRKRQEPYLRDVAHLKRSSSPVVDIGPGRCEWLEILASEEIPAYGCDQNEGMVALGRSFGVEVKVGDGIGHLQSLRASSVGAVTAFHVVEHLTLPDLVLFLDAALEALEPGGVLILETPNPTNLVIGASGFYVDPTHVRPLPPQLLEFLTRSRGFADVEVRFVNPLRDDWPPPTGDPLDPVRAEVSWWLFGPQDYAIVAKKPGRDGTPS